MSRPRTTLYLRGMPVDVVREAKAAAARQGCTLAIVVTQALERGLRPGNRSATSDGAANDFENAVAWFERNRESLLRKHPGDYVAIIDGEVVDHDADFEALAIRVFARLGARSVFMPRVERDEGRRMRVRSPRRVHA